MPFVPTAYVGWLIHCACTMNLTGETSQTPRRL
jgi:hypothetical protein